MANDAKNQNGLTPKEQMWVKNVGAGMNHRQAARAAGYSHPESDGYKVSIREDVKAALAKERERIEVVNDLDRKAVIDGLREAIDMGRMVSDPNAMVSGWREIAKICGYYAPETKRIEISGRGAEAQRQLHNMTDEELVRMIIEGESVRVPDDADGSEAGAGQRALPETVDVENADRNISDQR